MNAWDVLKTFDITMMLEALMRTIFYRFSSFIYDLINNLYKIFILLCNGKLISSETINSLSVRVGTILGVIMMLMVVFSFIQLLINPDTVNDKEKGIGNIVKKIVIVIVMLGTSTYVFNLLNNIQIAIIDSNVIANLLVPNEVNTENLGGALSSGILTAFYTPNTDITPNDDNCDVTYLETLKTEIALGNFSKGTECLNAVGKNSEGGNRFVFEFNWFLAPVVGVVILYFIFNYCISVGMRIIQLTLLQIISPMPIISYLSPKKDNMFSKWIKIYFSTYIDVFIRIAIINFISYLIGIIMMSWNEGNSIFWESVGVGDSATEGIKLLIGIIMILALLLFGKKAPDLISELLPSGGKASLGFGMKSPKALFKDVMDSPLAKPITAPIGFLGKRTLGGIDSAINGQGFWRGVGMSFFGGNFMQKYMPITAENRKHKQEGRKEVRDIDNKWKAGLEIVIKLKEAGANGGLDENGNVILDKNGNAAIEWTKVFNGKEENRDYYNLIFNNQKEFIQSKMTLDAAKKDEEKYKFIQNAITSSGGIDNYLDGRESFTITKQNGETHTYTKSNIQQFQDDYQSASDTLSSVKEVHESIRKQYQREAKLEDQYKFIKNNKINPANPTKRINKNGELIDEKGNLLNNKGV